MCSNSAGTLANVPDRNLQPTPATLQNPGRRRPGLRVWAMPRPGVAVHQALLTQIPVSAKPLYAVARGQPRPSQPRAADHPSAFMRCTSSSLPKIVSRGLCCTLSLLLLWLLFTPQTVQRRSSVVNKSVGTTSRQRWYGASSAAAAGSTSYFARHGNSAGNDESGAAVWQWSLANAGLWTAAK